MNPSEICVVCGCENNVETATVECLTINALCTDACDQCDKINTYVAADAPVAKAVAHTAPYRRFFIALSYLIFINWIRQDVAK